MAAAIALAPTLSSKLIFTSSPVLSRPKIAVGGLMPKSVILIGTKRLAVTDPSAIRVATMSISTFFSVPAYTGELTNTQFQTLAWVEPAQLPAYDFLEGDLAFVAALARGAWSHLFSADSGEDVSF